MKIYLGADHGGYELKNLLGEYAKSLGHDVVDCGALQYDKDDDYPAIIHKAAVAVQGDPGSRGVIAGGSGQGEAIAANRVAGIRCTVYYGPVKPANAVDVSGRQSDDPLEIIRLGREHNDTNVLSFGARFVTPDDARAALKLWLETGFSGDQRHQRRIDQLDKL